jgi:hypothetical protein
MHTEEFLTRRLEQLNRDRDTYTTADKMSVSYDFLSVRISEVQDLLRILKEEECTG